MPISRNRTDRRRRVMLDAIVNDADLALETARAKRRARPRTAEESDDYSSGPYRDPGYSQAVRRTCQQRLVQLIPVRRGTVAVVLTALWIGFGLLVLAHYLLHVRVSSSPTWQLGKLPIAQLFHLRSPHGISHWLTSQLWLLTALASWMIFSLRRHKLDDYRARYRIWIAVAVIALFLGFDAGTSGLMLFGMSIDGWTRREIGYGGWPLVYATVASLMGVLSIRLCSELKSVPSSVASWLFGLLACAASGLMGTGLLRLEWSVPTLELIVGGLWLGGILAVFQSAAMYLRHSYISAQKRFLQRNGVSLAPIQWKVPKIRLPRRGTRTSDRGETESLDSESAPKRWKLPWKGRRNDDALDRSVDDRDTPRSERDTDRSDRDTTKSKSRQRGDSAYDEDESVDRHSTESNRSSAKEKPAAKRLFGLIPNRHLRNEELEYEPVGEDEQFETDRGLTKKRGWFGIGGNKHLEPEANDEGTSQRNSRNNDGSSDRDESDSLSKSPRKSWFSRKRSAAEDDSSDSTSSETRTRKSIRGQEGEDSGATRAKRNWLPKIPLPKRTKRDRTESDSETESPPAKRSLLSFRKKNTSGTESTSTERGKSARDTSIDRDSSKPTKEKRSWFGMLDGLKLKPPNASESAGSVSPSTTKKSEPVAVSKPVAVKPGASVPSTQSPYDDEDEDSSRPMSKAERKRLRRQQDDRRAG